MPVNLVCAESGIDLMQVTRSGLCMYVVCYSTIRIGILVMRKHVIVSQIWSNFQRTVFSITKKSNLLCSLMGRAGEEIAKPSGNEEANYWSLSPTTT